MSTVRTLIIFSILLLVPGQARTQVKQFTVRDAIERVQFQYEGSRVNFSPDGKKFAMVTERGDLKAKANRSDILVFDVNSMMSFIQGKAPRPTPHTIATFWSTSNRAAVEEMRWADGGRSIVFLGATPGMDHQVQRYDLITKRLTQLSNEPGGVTAYGYNGGNTIIWVYIPPDKVPVYDREAFVIRNEGLRELLNLKDPAPDGGLYRVRIRRGNSPWADLQMRKTYMLGQMQNAAVSPDGTFAVTLTKPARIPQSWRVHATDPDRSRSAFSATDNQDEVSPFVLQWTLINLRTGRVQVLLDAPIGFGTSTFAGRRDAFWMSDSRHVILSDVLIPAGLAMYASYPKNQPYFVEMDVETGQFRIIADFPRRNSAGIFTSGIMFARWNSVRDQLAVRMNSNNDNFPLYVFERSREGEWKEREIAPVPESRTSLQLADPVRFEVRQALNDPPVLIGQDSITGREAVVYDPNPQFRTMSLGRSSVLEFQDATGRKWRGGLVLPVDYVKGVRYPLLIQTHGFSPSLFLVQGNGTTGYAAQALANRGLVVVQLQDLETSNLINTPEEAGAYAAAYEALVKKLDEDQLVDKGRIGIMGFSRTCFHVLSALVNSRLKFTAAVVHDGVNYGYVSYVLGYNLLPGLTASRDAGYTRIWGAAPVNEGLQRWIERVPSFNLQRVDTPLMIEAIAPPLFQWEWYAGLRRLNKPVEMRFIPGGSHELFRPQDQYFSQQGNVDWFTFWLKGEEDPDPAKAEQYKRWRELKKLQETNDTKRK